MEQDKNEFLFDVVLLSVTRFSKMLRLIEPKIVVTVAFAFPSLPLLSISAQNCWICALRIKSFAVAILYSAASSSSFRCFLSLAERNNCFFLLAHGMANTVKLLLQSNTRRNWSDSQSAKVSAQAYCVCTARHTIIIIIAIAITNSFCWLHIFHFKIPNPAGCSLTLFSFAFYSTLWYFFSANHPFCYNIPPMHGS